MQTLGYRPGEVLVRLKQPTARENLLGAQFDGGLVRDVFELPIDERDTSVQGPILRLTLTSRQTVGQAIEELQQDGRVAYACPNHIVQQLERPDDLDSRLYGLEKVQAPAAWDLEKGSTDGPKLAVIDSGIDYKHPELSPNLWTNPAEIPANGIDDDGNGVIDDIHGFNAVTKTGDPLDTGSHGTHVSGTVAARGNNGQGITGVAQQGQLIGCKFIDNGYGDTADAIAALLYAEKMGARLTNNSWGGSNYNQALYDTLKSSKALHICAAGNDSANNDIVPMYPASYDLPNVLTVAATDSKDELAKFSNFGPTSVDLAAPGDQIYSTLPTEKGSFGYKSGTSMASPHVAGAALLVATHYPQATNQEIRDRLVFGSDRLPQLEGKLASGGGRLNVLRSLEDDRQPPNAIDDLKLVQPATGRSVQLGWTASGDDGLQGQAAAYEMRVSDRPLSLTDQPGCSLWNDAPQIPLSAPLMAGQLEQAKVELLPQAQAHQVYVGLVAIDNVGHRGPLRQIRAEVPATAVAFSDNGENGLSQWTATGSWGLESSPGRGMVFSDSPRADYQCDQHTSLTSRPFSLQGLNKPQVSFDLRHDLEINFDKVFLEVSSDGQKWSELDSYNLRIGWEKRSYDLSSWRDQTIQLRFRLKTDPDVVHDGFSFDNLVVAEAQD